MKFLTLLFGFAGRIGRGRYWLAKLITFGFCFLIFLSAEFSAPRGGAEDIYQQTMSLALFALFLIVPTWAAIGTKRLHDRNKRGWWLLLYYPVPIALYCFATFRQDPILPLMIVSGLIFLWGQIELGLLPGTQGPNRFDVPAEPA